MKSKKKTRRWVVKIGSALLTNNGCGLKYELLDLWIKQIVELSKLDIEFVIVSSGAVAEGITRLNWNKRPVLIHELQAAAAVGQMGLVQAYESCFQSYNKKTAQILLTHDDIVNRTRYLNARTVLSTLLKLGVIPIINENDSVATDEICLGDNDTLAGLVANLIDAELLILLTDQKGLYNADPRKNSAAKLIKKAMVDDPLLNDYAGKGGALGRGGMKTKIKAATIAARSGTNSIIASGYEKNILHKIEKGKFIGTLLTGTKYLTQARKLWLANQKYVYGTALLDNGAVKAIKENGKSLLPVGVLTVKGDFKRGEIISCVDKSGTEIARGMINYNSEQAKMIIGKSSKEIKKLLGTISDELIHRDNMSII